MKTSEILQSVLAVGEYLESNPQKQITNADRIRKMTDEELAEWIADELIEDGYYEPGVAKEIWLDWLRKDVTNELG